MSVLKSSSWSLPAVLLRHQGEAEGRLHLRPLRQRGPPSLESAGLHVALLRPRLLHPQPLVPGQICPQKTQPGLVQRASQVPANRTEFDCSRVFVKSDDVIETNLNQNWTLNTKMKQIKMNISEYLKQNLR